MSSDCLSVRSPASQSRTQKKVRGLCGDHEVKKSGNQALSVGLFAKHQRVIPRLVNIARCSMSAGLAMLLNPLIRSKQRRQLGRPGCF